MWEDRLQELLAFRKDHGHVAVPRSWPKNPRLAHWVLNLRREIRTQRLAPERRRRLEQFGIRWTQAEERREIQDATWERMFGALLEFQKTQGTCDVPGDWPEHPGLGGWVVRQRHLLRRGALREDRRRRLDDAGVGWPCERGRSLERDRAWDAQCDALARYRREHGTCDVPKNWIGNPPLARWVVHQRHLMRTRTLRSDRRSRLEELGLEASALRPRVPAPRANPHLRQDAWNKKVAALAAFRDRHGHASVPRRWREDPALGRWVAGQRFLHREHRLPESRVRTLEALGFVWSRRAPASAAH